MYKIYKKQRKVKCKTRINCCILIVIYARKIAGCYLEYKLGQTVLQFRIGGVVVAFILSVITKILSN